MAAEQALARAAASKPALLVVGQFGTLVFGGMIAMFLLLAPWNIGRYSIGDEVVSGPEFLRRGGLLMGLFGSLFLAIGIGLYRDRVWTRPLMLAYWPLSGLLGLVQPEATAADVAAMAAFAAVGMAIAAWYLFGKESVKAYYAARMPAPPTTLLPGA